MTLAVEKGLKHVGETCGCADHDHDLIHELSRRLDALWRYDQYIANADRHSKVQKFFEEVKTQEQKNIERLKQLVAEEIKAGCF
jgi:hypothetical protein